MCRQENPLLHLTYVDNTYHKNLAVLIKRGQEVLNKSSASDSENQWSKGKSENEQVHVKSHEPESCQCSKEA